uniref:Tail protein n=1 Tax=viral metagenome TaxID=1070528 RepID=A0A6M3IYE9_9ZZZZ
MRTLSSSLSTSQKGYSLDPLPRITLSTAGESNIVLERDRIRQIPSHDESEDSQTLQVVLDNADGYFTALSLEGWDAVIEWGLVTSAGNEYSACAPLVVMAQTLSSDKNALLCYLSMSGIPDLLSQDKASKDYFHHKSDTKTVKDMITEVASGQPVSTELTEEQTTTDGLLRLDQTPADPLQGIGSRISIPNRTVTKVAFKLQKYGAPTGTNVTFRVDAAESARGTITNGTGIVTGSPVNLVAGANTPTITQAGTFTITLPSVPEAITGTATTGGWTITGSPVSLVAGDNVITVAGGGSGTITITLDTTVETLISENFAIASIPAFPTAAGWCEVTLGTPLLIDKEMAWAGNTAYGGVYIYVAYGSGDTTNYVSSAYNSYPVKPGEFITRYYPGDGFVDGIVGDEEDEPDGCYRYKYTEDGIDCFDHCEAYEVVYDPYGTHTGGTHATIMTDSAAAFKTDALIGQVIYNSTDGSKGTVTDNDTTTVTVVALTGGADNQWENGDAYTIEHALLDTYLPKDGFKIYENDTRLATIGKLLSYTGCVKRAEDDGKLHVFVPVTSGAVYDYEYSLAEADHKFFSKSLRDSMVIPNRVVVHSYSDDTDQYTGNYTSAASYALLPKSEFIKAKLVSNAQATALATARIAQLEMAAQRGNASVPLNVGAEVHDYIKVTDSRASDSRAGNIGSIRRSYNPNNRTYGWLMGFGFGKTAKKPFMTAAPSELAVVTDLSYDPSAVVTWGSLTSWWVERLNWIWYGGKGETEEVFGIYDLFEFLKQLYPDIEKILNYMNGALDADSTADQIQDALIGYQRRIDALGDGTTAVNTNVTASRAIDATVYQNTTGYEMTVHVYMSISSGTSVMQGRTDAATPPTLNIGGVSIGTGAYTYIGHGSLTFTVQNNHYYCVAKVGAGTVNLVTWVETTRS